MRTPAKAFARLYVDELEPAIATMSEFTGEPVAHRFSYDGLELAVVGSILIIAGPAEALGRYREIQATLLVQDLAEALELLERNRAVVVDGPNRVPTGRNLVARHADGAVIEYVELAAPPSGE